MPVIEAQLVKIEMVAIPGRGTSILQLNYQGQTYHLVLAVDSHKLETADLKLRHRTEQQLQQLMLAEGATIEQLSPINRYLLVREVGFYSLWKLARSTQLTSALEIKNDRSSQPEIELVRASIWLFQELWLQLENLLGAKQLQLLIDRLLVVTNFQSGVDLDRLLSLDPLKIEILGDRSDLDWVEFDRQLYQFTQKNIGHQFGTKLTIEIVETMPESLKSILLGVLNL
jgi:hypothetical protein